MVAGAALTLAVTASPVGGFEPRGLVEPPQRTLSEPSPLPLLASWHEDGDAELFRFGATEGSMPARFRLVTLSAYAGLAWSASATYRPVGVVGVPILPAGGPRATGGAEVTIAALNTVWVPGLGHPVQVSLSNVDYEAEGGSLALIDALAQPGLRYQVRAERDAATAAQVSSADVPPAAAAGLLLDLPRAPPAFAEEARRVTAGARSPFEQAVAIEYALGQGRRYDPLAPVGSSYARLDAFMFQPEGSSPGAQIGSSEQFAAAFAVLARSVGLPSRVVLGFRAGPDGVVRGRDSLAWPEIYFSGYGWYAFDPTPGTADPAAEQVKRAALIRLGQQGNPVVPVPSPTPTAPVTPSPRPTSGPVSRPGSAAGPPPATLLAPVSPVVAAVAAVLLALAILASLRAARRYRHRRAGVRGAWSELLDLLVLLGRPAPASRATVDIAGDLAVAAPAAQPHPALRLAQAADRAAFAPAPPVTTARRRGRDSRAGRRGPEARAAWSALRAARRAVRSAVPLPRRLLWTVDPRPLLRRRRT
jgi:transglutaminase-like putative cysteine protease